MQLNEEIRSVRTAINDAARSASTMGCVFPLVKALELLCELEAITELDALTDSSPADAPDATAADADAD